MVELAVGLQYRRQEVFMVMMRRDGGGLMDLI